MGIFSDLKEENKNTLAMKRGTYSRENRPNGVLIEEKKKWKGYQFWYFEHTFEGLFRSPLLKHRH